MDRILPLFKFAEVRAESDRKNTESQRRSSQIWPRLLSFNSTSQECPDDDDEIRDNSETECACDGDKEAESDKNSGTERCGFSKKLGHMYKGARFGLKEGTLAGIFFGGGFGMYKYFDAVYIKGNKDEGGSSDDNGDSTLNDNIIFVTAIHGAIAMAVFCTLFCSTKAAIYCN